MAYNEGTGNQLAYIKESAWAVPTAPGTTYLKVRKLAAAAVTTERTKITTKEMNNRRAVTGFRLGTRKCKVTVPAELSYYGDGLQFDDFMESWMCNAWTAAGSAIAAQTVTVGTPAAQTVLTCGTAATNIAVGQWIKVSGYTGAQIGNNGYYRVTVVASLAITVAAPNYATMVAGAAQGTSVVIQIMAYVVPGATTKSLAFEEAQTDNAAALNVVKMALGCMANTFELNIVPDDIVQCNFDFVGKIFAVDSTRALAAALAGTLNGTTVAASTTWTSAPTNSPMTANDTLMQLMVDNVAVGVVTNLKINGNNGLEEMFPIGALSPYAIGKNDSVVTGSMDIYMIDSSFWTKWRDETVMGLSVRLMDPDSGTLTTQEVGKGYAIDIPNIKLDSVAENKEKTKVIHNVPWSALELLTASTKGAATVNMRVSRLI
jgi:hypothetical protein